MQNVDIAVEARGPDGTQVRSVAGASDEAAWDRLLGSHPLARAVYPTYFTAGGWREQRIGIFEGQRLIGGASIVHRRIKNLPVETSKMLALMLPDRERMHFLRALLGELETWCLRRLIVETEVQLRIPANDAIEGFEWWRGAFGAFEERSYERLARVDRTYFVRIDRKDDALLASFGQQPRNRIKKAIKDGGTIEAIRDHLGLETFWNAYSATMDRKDIRGSLPRSVILGGLAPLLAREQALLLAERVGGRIANLLLVDPQGIPCAMLAARSVDHVSGEVSGAAQHVHYEAMRRMRDRGHAWYDFGGCEGPVPIEAHPNFGVWRMKHAFKGTYVTFMPYLRRVRGELGRLVNLLHRHRGDPLPV